MASKTHVVGSDKGNSVEEEPQLVVDMWIVVTIRNVRIDRWCKVGESEKWDIVNRTALIQQ